MRPLPFRPHRSRRLAAVALAGALSLGLAACSAGDDSGAGGSAADGASSSESLAEPAPAGADGAASDESADTSGASRAAAVGTGDATVVAAVADRKLARRAEVSLRVDDVAAAATRLRGVAQGAGGLVVAEQVSSDTDTPDVEGGAAEGSAAPAAYGTVTISVPTEKLDSTLDAVAGLGTVLDRRTSTDDVTGQYVDTASRVKSMQASVDRVRALMTKAEKLGDIVTLEAELSRRQSDLEALEQQLAALDDQVTLAPISVQLSTDGTPPVEEDPTGFLAGLASGWDAFTTSVRLVLTLVGALVPFAVALLVVVVPVMWWWRRRPHPVTTPPGPTPAA